MKITKYLPLLFAVSLLSCNNNKAGQSSMTKNQDSIRHEQPAPLSTTEATHQNPHYKSVNQTIEGYVKDGGNANVILDELDIGVINPLISVVIDEDGSFNIGTQIPEPGIYQLRFANGNIHLFLRGGTVKVRTDISSIGNYTVEGSPESKHLQEMYLILSEMNNKTYDLQDRVDALKKDKKRTRELLALVDSLPIYYDAIIKEKAARLTQFIERIDTSMVALLAAFYLDPDEAYDEIVKVRDKFSKICPYSKFYTQLNEKVSKIVPTGPGNKAIEIALEDINGVEQTLTANNGKITLLYFWSSFSQPCREDNLVLKDIYRKYRDKGFEIYAVSLDEEKGPWQKAIKDDGTGNWINVSNLVGWEDEIANVYRIGAIPYYILIDRDGIIISRGFKVFELEEMLKNMMKL